jgi:membrane protein required for colicin V production
MVSYFDLVLLLPMAFALWRGWKNGFVMEIFSLLALFAGIYLAIRLSDGLTGILRDKFDVQAGYLPVLSFVLILLAVGVGLFFLGRTISGAVKSGGGDRLNSIGGALFSLMKYLLILSLVFVFLNALDSKYDLLSEKQKENSFFYRRIYGFTSLLLPSLQESDFYRKLEDEGMAPVNWKEDSQPETESAGQD